jgi:hypothetical protein
MPISFNQCVYIKSSPSHIYILIKLIYINNCQYSQYIVNIWCTHHLTSFSRLSLQSQKCWTDPRIPKPCRSLFFRQSIPESTIYLPRRIWHAIWITSPHTFAIICRHIGLSLAVYRRFWEVECHTSSSCNSSILSQRSLRSFHYAQTRSLISLCHCAAVIFSSFLSRWKFKALSKERPIPLGGDQIQRLMQRKPRWFCLQPMTCHSHVAVMLPHLKSTPHLRRFARRFKHDLRSGWWFYITIWKNDGVRQWVSDDIPYIIPYIMEPYTILIMMENHPFMFHSAPTFVISSDATRNATRNALRPILPKSLDAKM